MKLVKTASGKQTIKMSRKEWQSVGKKAGWGLGSTPEDWEKDEGYKEEKKFESTLEEKRRTPPNNKTKDIDDETWDSERQQRRDKEKRDGYALAEKILDRPISEVKNGKLWELAKAYEDLEDYGKDYPESGDMLSWPVSELIKAIRDQTYWMR